MVTAPPYYPQWRVAEGMRMRGGKSKGKRSPTLTLPRWERGHHFMRILVHGINFSPELTGIGKYSGEMAEWLFEQM